MLYVSLTYDYELFLGQNDDSYDEILFKPTEQISKIMLESGAHGTFFVDVCSALAYKKIPYNDYYDKFTKQIQQLTNDGHDIQLHIHTNWYCAKEQNNDLILLPKGYRIHDFGFDETCELSAQKIIEDSKQYLESTLRKVNPSYKCIAYRAGGFAIQPERQLLKVLRDNGILLDSSVLPHMKANGINHYNYINVPNMLNWWINPEQGYSISTERTKESLFEIPVLTLRPRLFEYIGKKRSQLSLPSAKPKGRYVSIPNNHVSRNRIKEFYKRLFDYRYVSLDTRYYERVIDDLHYIYKKYNLDKADAYISLICHPKIADHSRIENIGRLINAINNEPERFKIITFSDIYNKI